MPELITAASPIEIQAKADEAGLSQDARDDALRLFHDLTSRIGLAAVGLHRDDGEEWPRHRFYFGPGGGSLAALAETLRARPDAPYSCTGGVCGTCRARLVSGEVRMDRNYALEPEEVAAGIVLACQSHPVTDEVSLDYDA